MVPFHEGLSEDSVHFRYFGAIKLEARVAHERLTQICFNDYDREVALVVCGTDEKGKEEILGVARLMKVRGETKAEFALLLSDRLQGKGLGTHLLKLLADIGRREGMTSIFAHILADNYPMQKVAKKVGCLVAYDHYAEAMKASLAL